LSDFRIFETDEFRKRRGKLPADQRAFLDRKLTSTVYSQLRKEPHFGVNIKKLRGYNPETWRYRIGRFRVFYLVDDAEHIVYVLSIEHRRDAY